MKKGDRIYLLHIQECIEDIRQFVGSGGKQEFFTNKMARGATLRSLQTLAESATRLSVATQSRCPEIPWRQIHGFLNILVHDYLGLDYDQVWVVIESELPKLRDAVERLLPEFNK